MRVVKVMFEGQTRKLPALICLKKVYPEELAHDNCVHYVKILNDCLSKPNISLFNEYLHQTKKVGRQRRATVTG